MFHDLKSMAIKHAAAGAAGAGVGYVLDPNQNMMDLLKYGGIVAGCSFTSCRLSAMLIPEFSNPQLANMQKIALESGMTAGFNILAQRYLNRDLRVENSAISGAAGGAAGVLTASMF